MTINNKRVRINPDKLNSAEILKRSFFKEAFAGDWTCPELIKVFEACQDKSYEFDELLLILDPYLDKDAIPDEYKEPPPLPFKIEDCKCNCLFINSKYYLYIYSLTEDFAKMKR
jgi:hypothetical protein